MISILTPTHIDSLEKLEWLNEAIASVQAQTLTDWELILVDDASPLEITLNTPEDDRIRRVRTTYQRGPALCRNTAAALANFEALLPLDSDDLLAGPEVLSHMFEMWQKDKSKFVYGWLQRFEKSPEGKWITRKVIKLPEYTFKQSMDLEGIAPVTAMHSVEAHKAAGGWKADLEAGLEDVEYWIACGRVGHCGQLLPELTLIYRRHEESRSHRLRMVNQRESEMRKKILTMHSDIYEGRLPMGCCGGGRPYVPPGESLNASQFVARPTTLDQYAPSEKVWVEYVGQREGSWGVVRRYTQINYSINGPGHKLEVHRGDLQVFERAMGGNQQLAFNVGVSAPNGAKKIELVDAQSYKVDAPEMAQIIRAA